jgi:hypothetical protein
MMLRVLTCRHQRFRHSRFSIFMLRRIVYFVCVAAASVMSVAAQSVASSEGFGRRLGVELDSSAIAYFGLFPRQGNVLRASVMTGAPGSVQIRLTRAGNGMSADTVLTLDSTEWNLLRTYIDDFETLVRNEKSIDMSKIHALFEIRDFEATGGTRYTIVDRRERSVSGTLLYADDSLAVLWRGDRYYDWRRAADLVSIVSVRAIGTIARAGSLPIALVGAAAATMGTKAVVETIIEKRARAIDSLAWPYLFGIGAGVGIYDQTSVDMPVEGNPLLYEMVLDRLRSDMVYHHHLPPELSAMIERYRRDSAVDAPPAKTVAEVEAEYTWPRVHVGVLSGTWLSSSSDANQVSVWDNRAKKSLPVSLADGEHFFGIRAGYDVTSRISATVAYIFTEAPRIPSGHNYHAFHRTSFLCTAGFSPLLPSPLSLAGVSASVAAGLGYMKVSTESELYGTSEDQIEPLRESMSYHDDAAAFYPYGQAEIAYHPLRYCSLHLIANLVAGASVSFPDRTIRKKEENVPDIFARYIDVTLPAHTITLTTFGLAFGLQVSL